MVGEKKKKSRKSVDSANVVKLPESAVVIEPHLLKAVKLPVSANG